MSKSESRYKEDIWDLPASIDYFAPAIQKLQEHTGTETRTFLRDMGKALGKRFAEMNVSLTFDDFLKELVSFWEKSEVGRLVIQSTKPLVISTSNCVVCGQLPEGGGLFRCSMHEGFFEGAIGAKLGRPIKITQEVAFKADAGTWSRVYTVE